MHAQKGVYALLLGSGVSRSAGIPTGWEVVLDLVGKLAKLSGKNIEGEEAAKWYKKKYKEEPNYSRLLDELTITPAERQQLLKAYFEPTVEEAEQGIKSPTPAHRAIADLVAGGYVRVILTTNFDRLIERAVSDKGIAPIVVASLDAVIGALPLPHSVCTVVKIQDILNVVAQEIAKFGNSWPPLKAGLFDGNTGRLGDIKLGLDRVVGKVRERLV